VSWHTHSWAKYRHLSDAAPPLPPAERGVRAAHTTALQVVGHSLSTAQAWHLQKKMPLTSSRQRRSRSGGGGNRTLPLTSGKISIPETHAAQTRINSKHINALLEAVPLTQQQNPTLPAQQEDKAMHSECAICVQRYRPPLPPDLSEVVDAWDNLPDAVRAGILAMVHATWHK
jgi:hypothetical protein